MKEIKALFTANADLLYIKLTKQNDKPITLMGKNILGFSPDNRRTDQGTYVYLVGGEVIQVTETYNDIIRAIMQNNITAQADWWLEDE